MLGGSMSSRLFVTLREKHGLAYYVRAEEENYTDSGYLTARAGVPTDKVPLALKLILNEFEKLKNKPIDAGELRKVKDLIHGRFTLQLEASDNLANWYGRQAILYQTLGREGRVDKNIKESTGKGPKNSSIPPYPSFAKALEDKQGGEIMTPEKFLKQIEKVTVRDIKRVANDIFKNDRLNLAVIGPFKGGGEFNKLLKL